MMTDHYALRGTRFAVDAREMALEARRVYYAMIENLEDNVGRLHRSLDHTGILDETIVVVLSDHGEMGCCHAARSSGRSAPEYRRSLRHGACLRPTRPQSLAREFIDVEAAGALLRLTSLNRAGVVPTTFLKRVKK